MESLISKIKEKKELKGLPDELIKLVLESIIKNKEHINSEKNKKIIIKEARSKLRIYTGQYAIKQSMKKRKKLLTNSNFPEILKEHVSTKERLKDYPLVKQIINKINPQIVLDLGCGLNPLAIATSKMIYHAYDINYNDLEIVKEFFIINKINGEINHKDIREETNFPKANLCLIFKVLDILGKQRVKITKKLLTEIDSKFFIISFATHTLSGKQMSAVYRRWFENILKNLNYKYEIKRTSNELFYIIEKN